MEDNERAWPRTRKAPTRARPNPALSCPSYRLCGIHVVAEAVNPLGEEVAQLLALEVLGWDEGSLNGTVEAGRRGVGGRVTEWSESAGGLGQGKAHRAHCSLSALLLLLLLLLLHVRVTAVISCPAEVF